MRAKEYAALYYKRLEETKDCKQALGDMFIQFQLECKNTLENRRPTDATLVATFREYDQKWRAIANLCNFNPDGYSEWINTYVPDVAYLMEQEHNQVSINQNYRRAGYKR